MSLWSRLLNVVRRDRLIREIDEEMESHLAEAIAGRDSAEARRAFGAALRHREASRDIRRVMSRSSIGAYGPHLSGRRVGSHHTGLSQVREIHTSSGRHVTKEEPFPNWVPTSIRTAARALSEEAALAAFSWIR
jgi:hypothetical protein